jgi:hypothetical protein
MLCLFICESPLSLDVCIKKQCICIYLRILTHIVFWSCLHIYSFDSIKDTNSTQLYHYFYIRRNWRPSIEKQRVSGVNIFSNLCWNIQLQNNSSITPESLRLLRPCAMIHTVCAVFFCIFFCFDFDCLRLPSTRCFLNRRGRVGGGTYIMLMLVYVVVLVLHSCTFCAL